MTNLKKIEQKIKDTYLEEKFKALCEMIEEGELQLKFLATKEAQDLMGKDKVGIETEMTNRAVSIRKAEKNFLKSL